MATQSCLLAWRIPQTEEPGGPQPTRSQSDRTEATERSSMRASLLDFETRLSVSRRSAEAQTVPAGRKGVT